jgi:hypothetical protein
MPCFYKHFLNSPQRRGLVIVGCAADDADAAWLQAGAKKPEVRWSDSQLQLLRRYHQLMRFIHGQRHMHHGSQIPVLGVPEVNQILRIHGNCTLIWNRLVTWLESLDLFNWTRGMGTKLARDLNMIWNCSVTWHGNRYAVSSATIWTTRNLRWQKWKYISKDLCVLLIVVQ